MFNESPTECRNAPILSTGMPLMQCTRACPNPQLSVAGTVITGTGRAGTSFLMAVLSTLGIPTGFNSSYARGVLQNTPYHAGLESVPTAFLCRSNALCTESIVFEKRRQVIKSPYLALQDRFPLWLTPPVSGLANVILPIRSSTETAASRNANGQDRPGGFWNHATDYLSQQHSDEHLLSTLMVELTKQDVDVTRLHYPSHVVDPQYIARKLEWLLCRYNISKHVFVKVHKSLYNMTLVHSNSRL